MGVSPLLSMGKSVSATSASALAWSSSKVATGCQTPGQVARIAASALVPQLHKPAADVSMLVGDRFGGLGLGLDLFVLVSHSDQFAGCAVIVLENGRPDTKTPNRGHAFHGVAQRGRPTASTPPSPCRGQCANPTPGAAGVAGVTVACKRTGHR